MRAGELRERFRFDQRGAADDGYGTTVGPWQAQFTVAASLQLLRRGEQVVASRLSGVQPGILTVRASEQARQITTEWRAVDARTGRSWNIRTVEPSPKRDRIEMLVEGGVADG